MQVDGKRREEETGMARGRKEEALEEGWLVKCF